MSPACVADILERIAKTKKARIVYLLYNLALILAAPLVLLYFLNRIRKDRRYARGFGERLGRLPFAVEKTAVPPVWLHAVSVGEVLAAVELVRALKSQYAPLRVYVSVTTVAGRALAEQKLKGLADGIFHAPLDYRFAVRRVLRAVRPGALVVLETEIWPNLFREAKHTGAALLIVNGRISDGALPRYQRVRSLFGAALSYPDRILAQSERDRARFMDLGAPPESVSNAGNLKYDFRPGSGSIPEIADLLERTAPREIWIAASTMPPAAAGDPDEDDVVIGAFRQLAESRPGLLLILVPRRPERFADAAAGLERAGVRHLRRSTLTPGASLGLPGVLLLDTVGELGRLFGLADVVFMGGTLASRGGHNVLEPAFCGKSVIVGPHMENFAEIAAEFHAASALVPIGRGAELAPTVATLLDDAALRSRIGSAARALAESKRGVTGRVTAEVLECYHRALPQFPGSALLAPLAALWSAATHWDRRRKLRQQRRLSRRTVSIGNITLGGAGKTPHAAWLAERAKASGLQPAILTRGYRRRSPAPVIALRAGARLPADVTGDEAQIFLRAGAAHLGIGADRYSAGCLLQEQVAPDLFILDDGFEHWRLHRDLDVVLLDALDPFGGGALVPRGRLREPAEALARAGAVVVTRAEPGMSIAAIESRVRQVNPGVPVFRSRVVPQRWVDAVGGGTFPASTPPFHKAAAFCGLANPDGFWRTLSELGIEAVFRWRFGDHHVYKPRELRRLALKTRALGGEALVTTEKDFANLPANFAAACSPFPVYYLQMDVEIEDAAGFLRLCLGA